MPSWCSGNTHGFCITGGYSPIASEPTPSRRLWAAAPGATPALRVESTTGGGSGRSKPERSTLLESGTFYFALTHLGLFRAELAFGIDQCRLALLLLDGEHLHITFQAGYLLRETRLSGVLSGLLPVLGLLNLPLPEFRVMPGGRCSEMRRRFQADGLGEATISRCTASSAATTNHVVTVSGSWLTSPARSPKVSMSPLRANCAATNTSGKSSSAPRGLTVPSESGKSASTPCSSSTAPLSANPMTTATRRCPAEGASPNQVA